MDFDTWYVVVPKTQFDLLRKDNSLLDLNAFASMYNVSIRTFLSLCFPQLFLKFSKYFM